MRKNSAYTLIEILLVMAIIAALAATTTIGYKKHISSSRRLATATTIKTLKACVISFEMELMRWPTSLEELVIEGDEDWPGPFLDEYDVPKDAWGRDFKYSTKKTRLTIVSSGEDGQFNTRDDIPAPRPPR